MAEDSVLSRDWPFTHSVTLRHRRGPLDLDVAFALDHPWTALFAPSGAGKTTILRLLAGLDQPQHGQILRIRQHPTDPQRRREEILLSTDCHLSTPAYTRGIRLVSQRPALFPHLSVAGNVGYGIPRSLPARNHSVAAALELCRASLLRDKLPSQLSGGEQQRVALGRALAAPGASLLLLDEPFTGLEADLRDTLIQDLRRWTAERNLPVLLVTHDLGEVFAAEAHVLKMHAGRLIASGPAADVLAAERIRLLKRLQG